MTRILQCGWETGDLNQIGVENHNGTSTIAPTVVTSSPTPRSGAYCLKCAFNSVNTNDNDNFCIMRFTHTSATELWYAFGAYLSNPGDDTTSYHTLFRNFDSLGRCNIVLRYEIGTLRVYYANANASYPSQAQLTLIGSASISMPQTTWTHIELRYVGATTAVGNIELYINGAAALTLSSVRTAFASTASVAFELGYYRLGGGGNLGLGTAYAAYDDLRVNDTAGSVNNGRPFDESIRMLTPNGAGDSTQFSRGGTDSGANYTQVDELPPNAATDYVYDSVAGHTDLYNMTTLSIGTISAINVIVSGMNPDGGGGQIYLPTKTGAGQSDGTAINLSASWNYYTRMLELDPADAAAWTQTKLDSLQIGIKVAS